jgi:hypothetical protein
MPQEHSFFQSFLLFIRTRFRMRNLLKIVLFFMFLFLLQIIVSYVFIQDVSLEEVNKSLTTLADRVTHDLQYQNGKWDISRYNSDPFTAYPNSSSSQPLYIITTEGFVIERSKPINGLLDTSDFKHLMEFQAPQTFHTVTNESWRVFSQPISRNNKIYGVIMVALYNPEESLLTTTDQELLDSTQKIDSVIELKNDELDISKVDIRNIHYAVSFEVVNKFNKVLVNDGRVPTFIDTSYISKELNSPGHRVIQDSVTKEDFLVLSRPLVDSTGSPVALIVAGRSVQSISNTLKSYLLTSLLIGATLTFPLSLLVIFLLRNEIRSLLALQKQAGEEKPKPTHISFDKKASLLFIDDKKIEIAYATNQYYLCKALFSAPKKRWEQDELLEYFGEDVSAANSRKVYDASLALNKKSELKLVVYQDKTYFINPELVPLIS